MALSTTFRALKYHNYRLYFSGQAISLIGTWMQRMAVSWLVYSITHSAVSLGIVVFAGQIPVLIHHHMPAPIATGITGIKYF